MWFKVMLSTIFIHHKLAPNGFKRGLSNVKDKRHAYTTFLKNPMMAALQPVVKLIRESLYSLNSCDVFKIQFASSGRQEHAARWIYRVMSPKIWILFCWAIKFFLGWFLIESFSRSEKKILKLVEILKAKRRRDCDFDILKWFQFLYRSIQCWSGNKYMWSCFGACWSKYRLGRSNSSWQCMSGRQNRKGIFTRHERIINWILR